MVRYFKIGAERSAGQIGTGSRHQFLPLSVSEAEIESGRYIETTSASGMKDMGER
jgi:hypothetical protein